MAEVSFGEWLKRRRGAEGWTQEQLAQKIHCSTSALRKFESEERRPSTDVVEQLAEIFNVPREERLSFLHFARGDWQAIGSKGPEASPWQVSETALQSNLPSPISSFVGRDKEQVEVIHLLKKNRLVTLSGPGGIGKTRLALQVGQQLLHDFPDGVWFVPLDSLSDPLHVPQTVASVFDVREGTNQQVIETLKNVLRRKTLLLILDNCEHLLDACAQLITTLLAYCPNLRILTTSREILNMEGEATYYLLSLSLPEESASPVKLAEYESIQLFIERARLAQSTFHLTEENARAVADISHKVDGIPLAIELTAACVNVLTVEEISKQLQSSFVILANDHRTKLPRHQTLQASLDWSWSLLTDAERSFLRQLSVFAGGWTLEAAGSVCDGNALRLMSALVQKSLVKVKQESEHETRYYFHEIVRQYAREKLLEAGENEAVRDKHLAYFVKLVEQTEPELYRSNQVFWAKQLDRELDNIYLAVEWSLTNNIELGLRLIVSWVGYWGDRGNIRMIRARLAQLLENYSEQDALHARALVIYGNLLGITGDHTQAQNFAQQGLDLHARFQISMPRHSAFGAWV